MRLESKEIYQESSRDTFWARVVFVSDDSSKQTTVLICASHEYLWDKLGIRDLSDEDVEGWLQEVIQTWEAKGETIFNHNTHYEVYATTEEGKENGMIFLKSEVNS